MFCLSKRRQKNESSLPPRSQNEEIPTPIDNERDAPLCSTCSAIHLRNILYNGLPQESAVPLGHITDIFQKYDQCGLCRLVATVIRRKWQLDRLPDINLTGITCALYAERCGYPKIQNRTLPVTRDLCHRLFIETSTRPRSVFKAMEAAQSHFGMEIQLLEEDSAKVGRTRDLHGRRVGETVNPDLLKRWIHTCENEHGEVCEKDWWRSNGETLPNSVRIVDVTHMAIVPVPPTCRYVALSYVWGGPGESYWTTKANLEQRRIPGGLDASTLPGTISDAIQLVRQLGERYLWIDALCIVQDDLGDKAVQIGIMELIYGSSAFTIIAVGCASARDPLPGVRPGTRDSEQLIIKLQGLHLTAPLAVPIEKITRSVWNERGWTYQEVVLSRRRIFFTAHQVHFECKKDVWNEDVVAEPIHLTLTWDAHPLKWSGMGQFIYKSPQRLDKENDLGHYMDIIEEYTQRKLTVESDIIDATMALLNALMKGSKIPGGDKAFRFGMPLVDLERALLWQPTAHALHSKRVPADEIMTPWPSWSWAAWRGAARYIDIEPFIDIQRGSVGASRAAIYQSLVEQWYIIDGDGQPVCQDVRHLRRVGEYFAEVHSKTYVPQKGEIDLQQLLIEHAPLQPGTLVFQTSSARFDVAKAADVIGADVVTSYAIYSILSDIPQPATLVGRIILPYSTESPTSCEFIVLSRAKSERKGLYDEDRLGKQYSGCMLYVMAVQKMQGEERVERVGVGVIFEHAWLDSTAEQRVVLLG